MFRLALIAICGVAATTVQAQHWSQSNAPSTNWFGMTCSADFSRLFALAEGFDANPAPMFASEDAGITWHQTSAPVANWASIACSANGQKLIAAGYSGGPTFWSSTNAGDTWIANKYPAFAKSLASSADGMNLVAGGVLDSSLGPGQYIETSSDGGVTWVTNVIPSASLFLQGVVSSANGTRLAALVIDDQSTFFWFFSSTNSGNTWAQSAGPDNSGNWGSLACSADGSKLVASISIIGIFISSDWGQSWQQPNPATNIANVALSADGQKLVMTDGASIYRSTDAGGSWVNMNAPNAAWNVLSISADGNMVAAAVARNGGIYTWRATSAPQLNIALSQANVVLSWSAPSNAILEQNADFTGTNWTQVALAPILTNGQYAVSIPIINRSTFYRLNGP